MSELTPSQLAAFQSVVDTLGPPISNAISESLGKLVLVDDPTFEEIPLAELLETADRVLQTNWTFPTLGGNDVHLIVSETDALELAAAAVGASAPASELSEDARASLIPIMEAVANGLGNAIGNATNRPTPPFGISVKVCPTTIGASFVTGGTAVRIRFTIHAQGGADGTLTVYLTQSTAGAIADRLSEGESSDAVGFPQELDPAAAAPLPTDFAAPSFAPDPPSIAGGSGFSGGPVGALPMGGPLQPFESGGALPDGIARSMDLIMDIPLDVSVELGRVQMLIKDVLELASGSIVELERVAGEPIDLLVNGQLIAKGEVVVIEDNFGIRITEIVSPVDRLNGMSKRAA